MYLALGGGGRAQQQNHHHKSLGWFMIPWHFCFLGFDRQTLEL